MLDIAPDLLEEITEKFIEILESSKKIKSLQAKLEKGTATYLEANKYAEEIGAALAEAYKVITAETLPDGKLYYNIADKAVRPGLENAHEIVSDYTAKVQKLLNEKDGLGLNAVKPPLNQSRVQGLLNKVASADDFDKVKWVLGEPIINFAQAVVVETLQENAARQLTAGLRPIVKRTVISGCCKWCQRLAGTYDYEDVNSTGNDVWRRHENCRCTIEYEGNGRRDLVYDGTTGRSNRKGISQADYEALQERRGLFEELALDKAPGVAARKRLAQEIANRSNAGAKERIAQAKKIERLENLTIANSENWAELTEALKKQGLALSEDVKKQYTFAEAKGRLLRGILI